MFIKIVSVVSMLFVLANAAKYKVTSTEKNLRMTKEQQIKAVKNVHQHIGSVKTELSKTQSPHEKIKKRVEDVKKLQTWNPYDSSFNSEKWFTYMAYSGSDCDGNVVAQIDEDQSYCYVGTIETSEDKTYQSAQTLFNSECTEETVVFYTTADCSGEPAQQGNTQSVDPGSMDTCSAADDDNVGSLKHYCSSSMTGWSGGGAVQATSYMQTASCTGEASEYTWILGGCYPDEEDGTSIQYSSGPTITSYPDSTDCSGVSVAISASGCTESDDDDDGDDDDNMIDDKMFNVTSFNEDSSTDLSWNSSSMGAILNYSMSIALVFMACSLFF